MAYTKTVWENSPSTNTPINATNLNKMDKGIYELTTGWISADETWTYSSVDNPTGVITITGDKTTKYSLGMRIKFTNNSNVIYGIITKISYSSPNTTITFLHEIDPSDSQALHLLQNSTISDVYYSSAKAPYGFPLNERKWSVTVISSTGFSQSSPAQNTWYNVTSISIPIGIWEVSHYGTNIVIKAAGGDIDQYMTLSTSASSESNSNFTGRIGGDTLINQTLSLYVSDVIDLSAKTTYYQNVKTSKVGVDSINISSSTQHKIIAKCNYL